MTQPSIAARLNQLPIVRTHRVATAIVGIGAFFDLFDIFLAGVIGTVLTKQFRLSPVQLQSVLASGFLGMFVGAVLFGAFADQFGRRTAFLINLGIYSAFTLVGAFSVNPQMLIASRLIAGVGIGAELPLCDSYLSELLPARHRGRYTSIAYTLVAPRCRTASVKPPVDEPTSSTTFPRTSMPKSSSAPASLSPPRETNSGPVAIVIATVSETGAAARSATSPSTRTAPARMSACARSRLGASARCTMS